MSLPIRTTLEDVKKVCGYLASKPTGATISEAKKILDSKFLDSRKVSALKQWGLISSADDGRFKLTDSGRRIVKSPEAGLKQSSAEILKTTAPYWALLERSVHQNESSITSGEVAAYWHEHFASQTSDSDKILNDQALCLFQLIEGASLGSIKIGRRGGATRVEFDMDALRRFIDGGSGDGITTGAILKTETESGVKSADADNEPQEIEREDKSKAGPAGVKPLPLAVRNDRVFITHGKNRRIVDQLKQIVTFGKFTPVVAEEQETTSKPVPEKVIDEMRGCSAGVIHIACEDELIDGNGNKHRKINENVLIEIGAAMALYRRGFILLVEKGVVLPSNLQGLYRCEYEGDKLDGDATMKLLKAFNDLQQETVTA